MTAVTFAASFRSRPELAVIDIEGDLLAESQPELDRVYAQAEASGAQVIALNFARVRYMNSTGIALIVALLRRAREQGRAIAAFGLSDHYQEVFQITRLSEFIAIYDDEETACQSLFL